MGRKKEGYTQVNLYVPTWAHKALKRLALDLDTTIQDWVEHLIVEALTRLGYSPHREYASISQLVELNWNRLVASSISPNCLNAYKTGRQPTEIDLLRIAMSLDMSEEEIRAIYARSFPNNQEQKERQANGV